MPKSNTQDKTIHKFTTQLVKDNALIVVGDVKSRSFTSKKTKLAKSTMMQDGLNSNDNWNINASMQVVSLKS